MVGSSTDRARTLIPLVAALIIQSLLLFSNLGLLTLWTDELFTLQTVTQPVARILEAVRNDIHPPLYFLLAHAWIQIPFPGDTVERIRALSCVWTLLATIAIDRLWLARLRPSRRYIALALWTLSPAVVLYGRMGRSYLMQTALAVVAVALTWRFIREPGYRNLTFSAAALVALLYTHYIPGLAIAGAYWLVLLFRTRSRTVPVRMAVLWSALIPAAYLPWLLQFTGAVERWMAAPGFSSHYRLTGGVLTEHALKLAYGFTSFTIGESFPVWALLAIPAVLFLLAISIRPLWRPSGLPARIIAVSALLGYIGVAHWVSYPFVPARLLWLLPFFLIWVACSVDVVPHRVGMAIAAFLMATYVASLISYYTRANFRNKGYAVPLPAIAALVASDSDPSRSLLMVDMYNTDSTVLLHYLDRDLPHLLLTADAASQAEAMLRDPHIQKIWIVRNTHDVSPGRITTRLEALACAGAAERVHHYMPYEGWERQAMRLAGLQDPPRYFYRVTECIPKRTPPVLAPPANQAVSSPAPARKTSSSNGNRATGSAL